MNATLMFWIMVLYITIPVVVVLAGGWFLVNWWITTKRSHMTKKRVTKLLRRHGAFREWKVLENVTLGTGDNAATADQLVVGPFGLLVACDLHQKGSVYGDLDAREWILTTGSEGKEKKSRIPSPQFAATRFVEQLRVLLAENKIYSVSIDVVLPKTQRQACFVNGGSALFYTLKELKGHIAKSKFEKDNGIDIAKLVGLFNK